MGSCQTVHNKISFLTKRNDATIIFFSTDHTVVWLDTVSYCYTNSLAIEYTFFEELFCCYYNFNLHEVYSIPFLNAQMYVVSLRFFNFWFDIAVGCVIIM